MALVQGPDVGSAENQALPFLLFTIGEQAGSLPSSLAGGSSIEKAEAGADEP